VFVIVPSASFTGGGAARVVLEWLYRVTGQQAGDLPDQPRVARWFTPYGFNVTVHRESCPRSVALVLIARKGQIED
jgi:hypothetical protein